MAYKSRARQFNKQSMTITFDSNIKEQLAKFTEQIEKEAIRPALYAGATVLYDELRVRVPKDTGALYSAIYRYRERENPIEGQVTYYVGVNKQKAPHWWWIEHGHWQYFTQAIAKEGKYAGQWVTFKNKPLAQPRYIPAKPYLRPTVDAKMPVAIQTVMRVLKERLNGLINSQDFN
jgi:hypothetical protein